MRREDIPHALEAVFGRPRPEPGPLLDCLIRTILSQNTNDRLRDEAYQSLRRCFPGWEEARRAGAGEIGKAIRVAGLWRQKARTIKRVLDMAAEHGYELSWICAREPAGAYDLLTGIQGVGDKTAKVCLLFSCGMAFFPVDTHINRVAKRLGLAEKTWSRQRVSGEMEGMFGPGDYYSLHINMIRLGREFCRPRGPRCDECPLRRLCEHARGGGQRRLTRTTSPSG